LKLLIISWYFPPVNTIGALRVGKFARFLVERGHDVRVVAGKRWGLPETLPLDLPLEHVHYADWTDINGLPSEVACLRAAYTRRRTNGRPVNAAPSPTSTTASTEKSGFRRVSEFYQSLMNIPDNRVGWFPGAYRAARRACRKWLPDLVFGTAPPFTALLACRVLSARSGLPWVAELRDRWADDPYGDAPAWRAALDQRLERWVLDSARALVTVTEPWAEFYRRKYGKPVATIYNGYDPLDFDSAGSHPSPMQQLVIGYTGGIYPGKRDPSPLFAALKMLGDDGRRFRVVFCGTDPAHVLPLAERAGVKELVEVRPAIPYRESLAFQQQSDVLLLMQWNDPREQGNCPGKFFEYVASLRPMLILGLEDGVPATIARERAAGFCINDPEKIADQLRQWLQEHEECGRVRPSPAAARQGLSRTIQFEKLERFLLDTMKNA
jgi:glycosyltransferase involved in cell wall biosynthesis